MEINNKIIDAIKYYGENTAYTAKGHFKSADVRKIELNVYIVTNIIFSVTSLALGNFTSIVSSNIITIITTIMGILSLFASIMIMRYQGKDEADYIKNSMKFGEEYLNLHNTIYSMYSKDNLTESDIEVIKNQINNLGSQDRPVISLFGRNWAKQGIEKTGEMNIWWK